MLAVEVDTSGSIFDGTYGDIINLYVEDLKYEIGLQALADVHEILNARIKHPTPYYETQVTIQRLAGAVVDHDRDIVYGPWLEGISERNRTTHFKGYAAFRKACEAIKPRATEIAYRILDRYVGRL
jgi:hypothetical protein